MTDNRAAIMHEARRLHQTMSRVSPGEWDWPRCLRHAHAAARGRKAIVANQMREIAAAIEAITFDPSTKKYGRK